jgi:hypothetical protein
MNDIWAGVGVRYVLNVQVENIVDTYQQCPSFTIRNLLVN